MNSADLRSAIALIDARVDRQRNGACDLLCDFGAERHEWLSRHGRRLLDRSSHLLLTVGERLEQVGPPPAFPLEGEVRGTC